MQEHRDCGAPSKIGVRSLPLTNGKAQIAQALTAWRAEGWAMVVRRRSSVRKSHGWQFVSEDLMAFAF